MTSQSLEEILERLQASLGEGHARAASALDGLGGHLALAREHLDTLGEAVAGSRNEVDAFAGSANTGLQGLREALAGHLTSIKECQERIAQSERALTERTEDLEDARQRIAQLESTAAEQTDAAQAAATRIAALEEQLSQHKDAIPRAKQRIEQLEAELAERASSSETIEGRASELERLLEEKGKDLAGVSGQLAEQQQAAAELREQLAAQAGEAEQAASAKDTLSAENDTLRGEVEQLRAAAEEAAEAKQALETERRKAGELEDKLQHETAKGTKTVIAEQLAEVLKELEEAHAETASLRRELSEVQGAEPELAAPPAPEEVEPQPETGPSPTAEPEPAQELPEEPPAEQKPEPEEAPTSEVEPESEQETAPESEVTEAQADKRRREREAARRGLGVALKASNTVTDEQLERALETLENAPRLSLREILVDQGAATEEAIAAALAQHHRTRFVRITEDVLDPEAATLVSQRIAQIHACVPLKATEEVLDLAMVDPLDLIAIEDVERASGRTVRAVVATASDIKKAIGWAYY